MKKVGIILLVLVLALGIFTACGGDDSSGKTVVRFASWDDAEALDDQQALVDRFNESQDEITVLIEAYGGDFDTKIAASMGSGDAPDVMYMWNYPAYYGGLEPLDPFIEREGAGYKSNFYDAMWPYNSIDGTIYGVPVGYTTHVLYYNLDMFDEAGVSYPTDSWTWNDLTEAARAITEHYNDGATVGFVFPMEYDPYDFEMLLWANGTAFCDASGNISGYVNSPAAVEAYSLYQKMAMDGIAIADEDGYGSPRMRSSTAAMYINGAWPIGSFYDAEINFGVTLVPAFRPGQKAPSVISSSGLAMSADSANKDAAWEFIKFWTGEEANIARIDYELPVLRSVVESQGLQSDPIKSVFYDMVEQSAGFTPASYIVNDWSQLNEMILLALELMWNPTSYADPQQTANAIVQ